MLFVELGVSLTWFSANRPIYQYSEKILRWESEYLDKGRRFLQRDHDWPMAPVPERPISSLNIRGVIAEQSLRFSKFHSDCFQSYQNQGEHSSCTTGWVFILRFIHAVYILLHNVKLAFRAFRKLKYSSTEPAAQFVITWKCHRSNFEFVAAENWSKYSFSGEYF